MAKVPSKFFIGAALLVAVLLGAYVATRRAPACGGDGKIMSTQAECLSWGVDAAACKAAIEKVRAIAERAAPRVANAIQCETQFTDCFESPNGGFYPRPAFCLRATANGASEPFDLRYLEYESDRMNRKKTHEVPIK
ncbi:MAG TPA: DUF1190 domain-containing protein [Methylocystis sp.]|nr:DUF1190 domain-containing protein [Methylocystis sp.]